MSVQTWLARRAQPITILAIAMCLSNACFGGDNIEVVSQRTFAETVQQLQWAFGGYGITTVSSMDYQQILKKAGVKSGSAVVFDVMRREWLKTLMSADPSLGAALPLRIFVYERDDGRTVVAYPRHSVNLADREDKAVREFGISLDRKLNAIVAQAANLHTNE